MPTLPIKIKATSACFKIVDAEGLSIAYVYFHDPPDRVLGHLSRSEAMNIAKRIARALSVA